MQRRGQVRGAWRTLIDDGGPSRYPSIPTLMKNRIAAITMHSDNLDDWLRTAPLTPAQAWHPKEDRGETEWSGTLLSFLGYQILTATNQAALPVFCDGCARLFEPGPRIPESRRKYCTLCRSKNVSGKDRQQQLRERKREIRRLSKAGLSVDEIAAKTGARPEKIRKWVATPRGQ